jgi:RHS repeat-associated protein
VFNHVDRARWKGALSLGPEVDLYYMRNRWYEPHTGRFLSEDPIGINGGMNTLVYGGNDPINKGDPTGLWCEVQKFNVNKVEVEKLRCWNLNASDLWTIEKYLGGQARGLRDLWNNWGWPTPDGSGGVNGRWGSQCRGGFSDSECTRLAEALSTLTLHSDRKCSSLGVGATKRFQAGRFERVSEGKYLGYAQKFLPWGKIKLDANLFTKYDSHMESIVAHEARHFQAPFAGGGLLGIAHKEGDSVYRLGDYCGGLATEY